MASYVRKVPTRSGARAVQIVHKTGRAGVGIEHIGSARDEAGLAALMEIARQRLHEGQQTLELTAAADELGEVSTVPARLSGARVVGMRAELLWEVLTDAYRLLGFEAVGDETFKALVCARVVEPTSKADTLRVLADLGVPRPSMRTVWRCLVRAVERDYQDTLATACQTHATADAGGALSLIMYDVTTLYFEIELEDDLRKVGMSKERRVDPQIQVGLLVDPAGFPLELHCFEGNMAETRTLIPVLQAFRQRHGVSDMVVVADAGMLSASNLNALEDKEFRFIVGSRISKAPYDLAEHFDAHGDYFTDGQILESNRIMGTGKAARSRRVVYHYSFSRAKRDNRAIEAMADRAEKVAAGTRPLKRDRFVKIDGADKSVNWDLVERARKLAGLKGYVTNISANTLDGQAVIGAYHDLWQVEKSFRMTKSDLRARPIFHHQQDSINAHLSVVFAALAISRHLQAVTGVSIRRIVRALRPMQTVLVNVGGHMITAEPTLTPPASEIIAALRGD